MNRFFNSLLSLFFLFGSSGMSALTDHLKRCVGKSTIHTMKNIDFIYMINLDQRPEKFAGCSSSLNRYGIYPYRFSAVNGWELTLEAINDVGVKYNPSMTSLFSTSFPIEAEGQPSYGFMKEGQMAYFARGMTPGAIGIALSHISLLKDAWESGYETIWVLEDDIEVLENPHLISSLIDQLDDLVGKENWDVLFTDQDSKDFKGDYILAYGAPKRPDFDCSFSERYSPKYTESKIISEQFKEVSARFGTYSMIIRRSGIKKLLDFAIRYQIYNAYDMDNYLPDGIKRYGLNFDLVSTQASAPTDNRKRGYELDR